jgi:hypothetical protein
MTNAATALVVWKEPRKASVLRVLGRAAVGGAWLFATRVVGWAPLRFILLAFAAIAFVHALLAVANLVRNKGVLLRLRDDGTLEWPRSIQEVLLGRKTDRVDGPVIQVKTEADHPGISRADPRVTLIGPELKIGFMPLHGTSVDDFIAHANDVLSPHRIAFERAPDLVPMIEPEDGRDEADAPEDVEED